MKTRTFIYLTLFALAFTGQLYADVISVSSQSEFDQAHDTAAPNDTIMWDNGTYRDIFMDVDNNNIYITAETRGRVIFTGASRVVINGDHITLDGFQFLDGDIGDEHVIINWGSNNIFTQLNIKGYTSYKYLIIREPCQYCEITYCNFEDRVNLDDQNIVSILVDENQSGFHKIQYCSFKNFDGSGNDLGIEPIRIGVSTQADFISRSTVEYCYFTQCNGDGEIISSKATQNVYRHNTFENNPLAELVLRHGSENIVYGNFFINGKGGVRVREGKDHYIYNNYFYRINDRTIYLQNDDEDRLDNINIAFNTIVDCAEIRLSESDSDKPTNVTLANNIFTDPREDLFDDATRNETWLGNIAFGNLGVAPPGDGLTIVDPMFSTQNGGLLGLDGNSPAIDAAIGGYAPLPNYDGIEAIDREINFDLMGQSRPEETSEKDLGCNEYPHNVMIQPIATEDNTGTSYDSDSSTAVTDVVASQTPIIELRSTVTIDILKAKALGEGNSELHLEIITRDSQVVKRIKKEVSGETPFILDVSELTRGHYFINATSVSPGRQQQTQTVRFYKG